MKHMAIITRRYLPVLLLGLPLKPPANLSANGPAIAGPNIAIHGATIDIIFDSSKLSPFDDICRSKNGNKQPIAIKTKIIFIYYSLIIYPLVN